MHSVVLDGYVLNPGDLSWTPFERLTTLTVYDRTPPDLVLERACGAEILLATKTRLTAAVLHRLRGLKYIGVLATGYDNVDVAAARELGIVVTNIPSYGTDSVAQFVFALLLELCHRVQIHSDAVRAGEWSQNPDWTFWKTPLTELAGKTMGIVGFGRIGRRVARISEALGMTVIASDPSRAHAIHEPLPFAEFRWAAIDELLQNSDVVTLHCPLLPSTQGLIDAGRLRTMKTGSMLINTSRGALVVDRDLADALNRGHLAGAAVDVLAVEPPPPDNPLFAARNCIVTPHMAWATQEARARLMRVAVRNLESFLNGDVENAVS